MKATGQKEVSLVDPDSRLMRVDSQRLKSLQHSDIR